MPDIAKYSGITMADIAKISGQTVPSGGGGGVSESNTGILYFEGNTFNTRLPDAEEFYGESSIPLYRAQLSTRTDIVEMKDGQYHSFALDSSGNLYSSGWTNTNRMGRAVSSDAHQFVQCLTSVSKFAPHDNGCWAIKTNGELWWCGQISQYADSGDTGTGSITSTANGWSQFGSDTDWIDIDCFPAFPTVTLAIKGGTGSEYLYSCGSNFWGKSGVGTTSGSTKPFTRVKSDATTDWSETIDKVSVGYNASMAVTTGGKFFAWGDANDGHVGQGNTTDQSYPIQVGTDTDWATPYAKARLEGFCIKTDGSLYGSRRSTFYYNIGPSTSNRTYGQCGTDTDYEVILASETSASSGLQVLFAKKNGSWYANWGATIPANSFVGNTSTKASPADNTWVTINSMLEGNDITVGINWILLGYKENNQSLGEVMTIATAAT
jgi:alpha-tubulin suppressor-like RCC1 family protein